MRTKQPVRASQLQVAQAGRADTEHPFDIYCTFSETRGPGGALDPRRETVVRLTLPEVAQIVGAIPASMLEPEHMKPLIAVMDMLHSKG